MPGGASGNSQSAAKGKFSTIHISTFASVRQAKNSHFEHVSAEKFFVGRKNFGGVKDFVGLENFGGEKFCRVGEFCCRRILSDCIEKNTSKIAKNRVYKLLTRRCQSVKFDMYGNVQKYYSTYFIIKRKEEISNGDLC